MSKSKRDKVIQILRRQNELLCLPEERDGQTADAIMQLFEKKKKEADPCFTQFVEIWHDAYPILGFDGSLDGSHINKILLRSRTLLKSRGKDDTCEALINSFKYVIDYVKREKHFCDGQPITTWSRFYLSIIHEIANGKITRKNPTTRERIDAL